MWHRSWQSGREAALERFILLDMLEFEDGITTVPEYSTSHVSLYVSPLGPEHVVVPLPVSQTSAAVVGHDGV